MKIRQRKKNVRKFLVEKKRHYLGKGFTTNTISRMGIEFLLLNSKGLSLNSGVVKEW